MLLKQDKQPSRKIREWRNAQNKEILYKRKLEIQIKTLQMGLEQLAQHSEEKEKKKTWIPTLLFRPK